MDYSELYKPLVSDDICSICLTSQTDFIIPNCGHSFCKDCLQVYLETLIKEGHVLSIMCPMGKCTILNKETIQSLVTDDIYNKYNEFFEKKTLEASVDFRWCPKRSCKGYSIHKSSNRLKCNTCSTEFCFLCRENWHENECPSSSDFFLWSEAKQTKLCPNCKVRTQKNGGCPSMTCSKCAYRWCWRCGKSLNNHNYYSCIRRIVTWYNMPLWVIGLSLFFPILILFAIPIISIIAAEYRENGIGSGNSFENFFMKHPYIFALITLSLSPIIIGILALFCIIGISYTVTIDALPYRKYNEFLYIFLFLIIFCLLLAGISCLVVTAAVLIICIAVVIGVGLFVIKVVFNLLRFFRAINVE